MNDPIYDFLQDPGMNSPAGRFVMKILLDAHKRGVSQIRLKRISDAVTGKVSVVVFYRTGDKEEQIAEAPDFLWGETLSRLKVMARMVDYGPQPSTDGQINLRLSATRTANFYIPVNPHPESTDELSIMCEAS